MAIRQRLRSLLWRVPVEQEVHEELAHHIDLKTRELIERGVDPADARAQVERFIRELARRGNPVDRRTHSLVRLRPAADATLSRFADELGVSDRALRSWSSQHLGLGLKRCLSIRRLHNAIESRLVAPRATWSRIAAAHGFADQSHLVRDCRAMLGESPSEFLARAG